MKNENPKYLFSFIPARHVLNLTQNIHSIPLLNTKHNFFKNFFSPLTIIEWNNLDICLRKSDCFSVFESNILKFIQPSSDSVYNCRNPREICLITRLRVNFRLESTTVRELCSCGNDVESTEHFLHHCPQFVNERHTLLSTLGHFNYSLLENTGNILTQTLHFGNTSLSPSHNFKILNATIDFVLSTKKFDEQLF